MSVLPQIYRKLVLLLILFSLFLMSNTSKATSSMEGLNEPNSPVSDNDLPEDVYQIYLPLVSSKTPFQIGDWSSGWSMAGANPERTSWTAEEVKGSLKPIWFKPFEPYILQRVQIVAAHGNLYISTAKGLYALDAATGADKWVYPTEMPLGHSPTVYKDMVIVGGFDRQLHAINALNGQKIWTFQAGAGFDTNPLVIDGKVFVGNRDGFFYAVIAEGDNAGKLVWKYQTQGPIHYSAAYKNGVVFFASNDSHAYALDAQSGKQVWKSAKLPGAGFHSWWPVIYRDYVIFSGSYNYRFGSELGASSMRILDMEGVYPNYSEDPRGTLVGPLGKESGDWAAGTPTIDTSKPTLTDNGSTVPITEYFEKYPWRRTYFVLERATGSEYKTDLNNNGKPEYAPFLWFGTAGGNRYPPVVGSDGVIYQSNNYMSDKQISGGHITGWKVGTPHIGLITSGWNAIDEPIAHAAGGNLLYWSRCCDRVAGAIDITIPYDSVASSGSRSWSYFSYNLDQVLPGYNAMFDGSGDGDVHAVFGNEKGIYGYHGDGNPPIPYQGKVFMHRSNAVIAFGPGGEDVKALPVAIPTNPQNFSNQPNAQQLKERLAIEVDKMVKAGHLRPGYLNTGIFDMHARTNCGDRLIDYWHQPGDTLYALLRALPHLPNDLQPQTRQYLQKEFEEYPPYQINHIGWQGAPREIFDLPPEIQAHISNSSPSSSSNFPHWNLAPQSFYAMWKYAEVFGNAKSIFDASKNKLATAPPNDVLFELPHIHNAFIAGYIGYLELEKLAGYTPESKPVADELKRLLELRAETFSTDTPDSFFNVPQRRYCRTINVSKNFMYMVPELGQYLKEHAYEKVKDAIEEYEFLAPYWFVSQVENAYGEGVIQPLYDYHALFHAKAWILGQPQNQLVKYLDVPAFSVGDLFYIHNLVTAIETETNATSSTLEHQVHVCDSDWH
jgi:hypothetical protein